MRPRHILMTADAVGGVWTYSLDLARALAAHDIRTTLAVMGPPPSETAAADAESIPGLQLHTRDYKLEWMDSPWTDVDAAGAWLLDLCTSLQPDLMHLNGYAHGALSWSVPSVVVAHSCVYGWWQAVHRTEPPRETWAEYHNRVRAGLAGADAVAAVSATTALDLERHYGFSGASAIANGRDQAGYQTTKPREPLILTCGRIWDVAKNIATLDAAAKDTHWPVFAAGSTANPDGSNASPQHLKVLGLLTPADLRGWYGRASIYALPAVYEPFGLSVLEAALSGCALVLADISSLRENWSGAALFVDPRDRQSWAETFNSLTTDMDRIGTLSRAAQQRAARFTLERQAEAYLGLYEEATLNFNRSREARTQCAS